MIHKDMLFGVRSFSLAMVVGFTSLLLLPLASAANPKIGFVSTERILRDSNPAKAAQKKLEAEFAKREKEVQDLATKLRSLSEKLERDAPVMAEADRAKRQREVADMERDIQRRQREFREDLNQRRNEELATVVERANRAIRQIAEAEKYDVILQEAVYASPAIDITEKVIKSLNAQSGSK
ncbi:MAG: Chaperone protein Skp precursor [Pseudomonadota bacterium]|jgi:outer membrane protein